MKKYFVLLLLSFSVLGGLNAQDQSDTIQRLQEVVVKAYFSAQPVLRLPGSVSILNSAQIENQPQHSLVSAMNTVPGVRMEERSPGSYRLSIRGSLLRSPFGVRNVKIYVDEFPLTDAGGNTYFNLLDARSVNRIEILKGPEASVFGANSGGVIVVNPYLPDSDSSRITAAVSSGSYGLFQERLGLQKQWEKSSLQINQAYQTSDGFRDNSNMQRNFANANYQWKYSKSGQLRSMVLYSDLRYQTPGGLTASQMQEDPQAARFPTATLPGAIEQRAGVVNKTIFGGLLNEYRINNNWRHVVSVFGSHTDFENSFITNYEVKDELNGGVRTYLELKTGYPSSARLNFQAGMEGNYSTSDISVFDNNGGVRAGVQAENKLNANYNFLFTHFSAALKKWYFEAAASLNFYNYKYRPLNAVTTTTQKKKFDEQLMPRVALSYLLTDDLSWRASVSKGYSPPTIDEVTGSNNMINPDLQPEHGWNYETGFRYKSSSNRVYIDAVVFRYDLNDAIVRRLTESDVVYFVNAGGAKDIGVETQISAWLIEPNTAKIVRSLKLNNSITYSDFKFTNYLNAGEDYSGNRLTGVPKQVFVTSADLEFPKGFHLFSQHNYTSSIPLNDAGTQYGSSYHLVQVKAGWRKRIQRGDFNLFAGIDNLLDENYSLGNDLNAAGNRYFNPSPGRNYYLGISATFR
jgi:iron complex outermembrane recepter protein